MTRSTRDARLRSGARVALGGALVFAGTSHLTFARQDKRALRLLGQPLLVAWAWWSTRTVTP